MTGLFPMHICLMQTRVNTIWQDWKQRRKQRRLETLWKQHQLILQNGLRLRGRVADIYPSQDLGNYYRLVRVKLEFDVPGQARVSVISKLLLVTDPSFLRGRQFSFKFLSGDLSQIVIVA